MTVLGRIAITVRSREAFSQRIAQTPGGFGLAQKCEGFAHFAQLVGFPVHAPGDAFDRAEQVDQNRCRIGRSIVPDDVLEQDGRAALGEQAGLDFGHFQMG